MKQRKYSHIVRNSLSESTCGSEDIFKATSSKTNIIPVEEEIEVHFSSNDDVYAHLRA